MTKLQEMNQWRAELKKKGTPAPRSADYATLAKLAGKKPRASSAKKAPAKKRKPRASSTAKKAPAKKAPTKKATTTRKRKPAPAACSKAGAALRACAAGGDQLDLYAWGFS